MFGWMTNVMRPRGALVVLSVAAAAVGLVLWVTAFFNGRHFLGNLREIPLLAHAQIQLDVGRPLVGPESIQFPPGL